MNENNIKKCIALPDVCRCCLSTSGTWDLTTGYVISSDGIKELFSDLLYECFGLNLAHLNEWGRSRVICGLCLGRLRDASGFKKQVLKCEEHFMEYVKNNIEISEIKVEDVSVADNLVDDDMDMKEEDYVNTEKIKFEIENDTEAVKKYNRRAKDLAKKAKKSKRKKKKEIKANSSRFCEVIIDDNGVKDTEHIDTEDCDSAPTTTEPSEGEATHIRNTRLRHNMTIMLKYSTIVPFRYLVNTNNQYTCQYCEEKYFLFEDLRRHVHDKHPDISQQEILKALKYPVDFVKAEISDIRCKICDRKQENLDKLADHLSEDHKKLLLTVDFKPHHGVLGFVLDTEKLLCQMCFKEINNLRRLISHISEHCENFSCKLCGKKFFSKRMLAVHALKHNNSRSYKCKFCEKTFEVIGSRTYHMKKEHNYGKHKCSECGESFIQYDQRTDHLLKVHNIRKPTVHFCEICCKEYANASTLKKHMQYTHWNDKRHICDLCGKRFTFKNCLTKHLRVHSGEKPFECKICNKKFGQNNTLRVHLRGHANDKRYVCEICGTAFIQKHCLKRHYSTHHPESEINRGDSKTVKVL